MTTDHDKSIINILLVEDNIGDVFLITQCLQQSTVPYQLHRVEDGEAATDFLEKRDHSIESPRPDLILLDLNLPRKDGRELLAELKSNPKFQTIPVIVLTGSSAPADITQAYQLHANCYMVKPSNLAGFREAIQAIELFWFKHAQFPRLV